MPWKLNLRWTINELVKSLIVDTLFITKKYIGKRHLIVSRDQLKSPELKEAWDEFDRRLVDWEHIDLQRTELTIKEGSTDRTSETVRNGKYILFTLGNEDEAYEKLILRMMGVKKQ